MKVKANCLYKEKIRLFPTITKIRCNILCSLQAISVKRLSLTLELITYSWQRKTHSDISPKCEVIGNAPGLSL